MNKRYTCHLLNLALLAVSLRSFADGADSVESSIPLSQDSRKVAAESKMSDSYSAMSCICGCRPDPAFAAASRPDSMPLWSVRSFGYASRREGERSGFEPRTVPFETLISDRAQQGRELLRF